MYLRYPFDISLINTVHDTCGSCEVSILICLHSYCRDVMFYSKLHPLWTISNVLKS